jgi:murein DD-endopeptidase MepM/ murein hydrolase activator NlpD
VADTYNDRIRRIAVNGEVTTIAGGGRAGLADGEAAQALFNTPCGLALAANGDLYIADTGNSAVRKLGKDGKVSTIALAKDDDRKSLLRQPIGIAVTKDSFIYIASAANGRVAQISPAGEVAALPDIDHPEQTGYGSDGTVRLYAPRGLALDRDGSLYISDAGTFRLVHVTPPLPGEDAPPENPLPGMPSRPATMLWPVKPQNQAHEVVGLMGEVRGNFEGESRDHFHSGLDVQAAVGTPVLTVVAGKVTDPRPAWGYGELAEGIALDGLRYIHMRVGRTPNDKTLDARFAVLNDEKGKPAAVRVKRGTRFLAGETVGTVNRMAHVHLDYVPNGDALNPLSLPFIDLNDTIEPQIQSITLTDANGLALKEKVGDRLLIKRELGEVQIVVEAYDQMNGDQARRKLGIYKLGYQLLSSNGDTIPGMEQPIITQVYDRLPRNREAVKLMYAGSSGITVHGAAETRFIYALNNTLLNGKAKPTGWKVSTLGPGNYILRILAADYAGNVASKGRDLAVVVD